MDSRQVAGGRRCRLIKTDKAEIYKLLGGKDEDLHTLEHEIEDFVKNEKARAGRKGLYYNI